MFFWTFEVYCFSTLNSWFRPHLQVGKTYVFSCGFSFTQKQRFCPWKRKIWFYFSMYTGKTAFVHCDMIFSCLEYLIVHLFRNLLATHLSVSVLSSVWMELFPQMEEGENTVFQNTLLRINVVLKWCVGYFHNMFLCVCLPHQRFLMNLAEY